MAAAPTPQVRSSRYEEQEELAEATAAHAEGEQPAPESPHPPVERPYAARGFRSHRARPLTPTRPERREGEHAQDQDPTGGHAQGVPEFPEPLPGYHHYREPDPARPHQPLDVGPAEPYYSKGMAHGVPADVHHGGRPAPAPAERGELAATRQIIEEETWPEPDPVPVYIVESSSGNRPMLRSSMVTRTVPAPGADVIVLVPRDLKRSSVRLLNESSSPVRIEYDLAEAGGCLLPANMTSYLEIDTQDEINAYVPAQGAVQTVGTSGSVTGPTALQSIVATSPETGTFLCTVTVYIDGTTAAATDDDNMEVTWGSSVIKLAVPATPAGTSPTPVTYSFSAVVANQTFAVKAIAAGTGTADYHAQIMLTPQTVLAAAAAAQVSVISQYEVAGGA